MKTKKVIERCPHCEKEVKLDAVQYKLQKCPNCKAKILPCAMCDLNKVNCSTCRCARLFYRVGGVQK